MNKENITKGKIKEAAFQEFSMYGLKGSRVENIAKKAGVNKAMIFYYFRSKDNLYIILISESFSKVSQSMTELVYTQPSASEFCEKAPQIFMEFFATNPEYIKMVLLGLIQKPDQIKDMIKEMLNITQKKELPFKIGEKIRLWYKNGEISEPDPEQFMLNILSLSFFSGLVHPIIETLFDLKEPLSLFKDKRINSIKSLLKGGMLNE